MKFLDNLRNIIKSVTASTPAEQPPPPTAHQALLDALREYKSAVDAWNRNPSSKANKNGPSKAFNTVSSMLKPHEAELLRNYDNIDRVIEAVRNDRRDSLIPKPKPEIKVINYNDAGLTKQEIEARKLSQYQASVDEIRQIHTTIEKTISSLPERLKEVAQNLLSEIEHDPSALAKKIKSLRKNQRLAAKAPTLIKALESLRVAQDNNVTLFSQLKAIIPSDVFDQIVSSEEGIAQRISEINKSGIPASAESATLPQAELPQSVPAESATRSQAEPLQSAPAETPKPITTGNTPHEGGSSYFPSYSGTLEHGTLAKKIEPRIELKTNKWVIGGIIASTVALGALALFKNHKTNRNPEEKSQPSITGIS